MTQKTKKETSKKIKLSSSELDVLLNLIEWSEGDLELVKKEPYLQLDKIQKFHDNLNVIKQKLLKLTSNEPPNQEKTPNV